MIHIDAKITIWERFTIGDEHKEALKLFLKENPDATYLELYEWAADNDGDPETEYLEGTDEPMTTAENGGFSTLEILQDSQAFFSN